MAKKLTGYQLLKQALVLLTQEPATSYDLARQLGVKPAQLGQKLRFFRRHGWIEVVSHARRANQGLTPVYAIPEPRVVADIQRLYGGAELPKRSPARDRWCNDDDLAWMSAQQARKTQINNMRSRV